MRFKFLLLALAFAMANAGAELSAAERPNLLFAFADDWGRYASCYAAVDGPGSIHEVFETPNIDRVAGEGVVFRHAFVTAPSCTPCRSSLLSGKYFFQTGQGAILQGAKWDPAILTFPLMLEEAGYHIGQTYKVWSPGRPNDAGYGGERTAYDQGGARFNQFSQNVTRMMADGQGMEAAKAELLNEVAVSFDAFLADREAGEPFCYWFGPTNVHRRWTRGSGQALWGIDPDELEGRLPAFLPDDPVMREDFADYLGEVMAFDAALGVLIERLEKAGELDNTLIVVSGDHGAPGFPRGKCNLYDFGTMVPLVVRWAGEVPAGRVVNDFVNLMDLAPTFLEAGGLEPVEGMVGRSLVPVLRSEKAGWVDRGRDWVITGRERHVAKAREGQLPYPQRALRTRDHLYIVNFKPERWPMGDPGDLTQGETPPWEALANRTFATFSDMDAGPAKALLITRRDEPGMQRYFDYAFAKRPREELYVLKNDPDQIRNVAGDPAHEEVRADLEARLMAELRRLEDPRVMGEGLTFERPPFAGD